ncbi:MAG: hypothetical protein ACRETC_07895 [Gammaproteobacteria bacterium]
MTSNSLKAQGKSIKRPELTGSLLRIVRIMFGKHKVSDETAKKEKGRALPQECAYEKPDYPCPNI